MAPLRVPVTIPATGVPLAGFIGKIHVTESNPVPPIPVEIGGLTWRGLDPATLTDDQAVEQAKARARSSRLACDQRELLVSRYLLRLSDQELSSGDSCCD